MLMHSGLLCITFCPFLSKGHIGQGQRPHGSMSVCHIAKKKFVIEKHSMLGDVNLVKVKGHRVKVKGHLCQGLSGTIE